MQLTSIVIILIRIIALQISITTSFQLLGMAGTWLQSGMPASSILWVALALVLTVAANALLWIYAVRLAQWICGRFDTRLSLAPLRLEDLYCTAMVFIGMNLLVSAIPNLLNYAHYFLKVSASFPPSSPVRDRSFYDLARFSMETILGIALFLWAPRWARLLITIHKCENVSPNHAVEGTAK